jgi:hypothetical protein
MHLGGEAGAVAANVVAAFDSACIIAGEVAEAAPVKHAARVPANTCSVCTYMIYIYICIKTHMQDERRHLVHARTIHTGGSDDQDE